VILSIILSMALSFTQNGILAPDHLIQRSMHFFGRDILDPLNCKLTLQLRLRLQQINPGSGEYQDSSGRSFPARDWTGPEWMDFIVSAKEQADMWNNKFWLKPPPSFTKLDVKYDSFPGQVYRPYIRCELEVDFFANAADAHRIIPVVNLDIPTNSVLKKDGQTFTSSLLLFDSLDKTPSIIPFKNVRGLVNKTVQHYTIAHEIGHALGLDHIGVLLKLPLCVVATFAGSDSEDFRGGTNAHVCYGQYTAYGANIMGAGSKFSVENAKPWVWAITYLEQNPFGYWEVLLRRPAEQGFWVRL